MASAGANIEALLSLDVSNFEKGITKAIETVESLETSIKSIDTSSKSFTKLGETAEKSSADLSKLEEIVISIDTSLNELVATSKNVERSMKNTFKNTSNSARKTKEEIQGLKKEYQGLVLDGQFSKMVSLVKKDGEALFQQATAGIRLLDQTASGVTGKMRKGLDNYIAKLNNMNSILKGGKNFSLFESGYMNWNNEVKNLKTAMKELSSMAITPRGSSVDNFSLMGTNIETLRKNIGQTSIATSQLGKSFEQLQLESFYGNVNKVNTGFKGLWGTTNQLSTATQSYAGASSKIRENYSQLYQASDSVTQSQNRLNQANNSLYKSLNNTATASKNASNSYSQLNKTMNSLKMVTRTVASLFAYDIVLSLTQSVRTTLQQKSEMEAFQHTMGMTANDIKTFNSALDSTVAKFGKLSKFNLGETVASLGVEFNLTNKQMQQAMNITAMLQSEYVRAGRTADEATLAVKDILQGEFVRLSRETGVGKGELVAAGWSGDTTDIATLMDALEKVATSRHWDIFAAKATSLSDVLQITRSRISDFAASLLDNFTPAVTSAFGILANGLESMMELFGNIGQSMANNPWINNIYTKLLAIGTAIGILIPLMVNFRTGANLIQMAQMGWAKSIAATILGINAETAANATSLQMLMSKITGYTAEQVAAMGSLTAIKARILGLNGEVVAENGLKAAVMGSVMSLSSESTVLSANTAAEVSNQIAKASTLEVIIAKATGVSLETVASEGLTVAIIEQMAAEHLLVPAKLADIAATEGETAAHLALAAAMVLSNPIMLAVAAAAAAIAVALYGLYQQAQKTADTMKGFNELVNSGDQILKNKQATIDAYKEDLAKLDKELQDGSKSESELEQIQKKRDETQRKLTQATEDYNKTLANVEHARSVKNQYDQTLSDQDLESAEKLEKYYKSIGMSAKEAQKLSDPMSSASIDGGKQMSEAAANYKYWSKNMYNGIKNLGDGLKQAGVEQKTINSFVEDTQKSYDKIRQGKQKQMTGEDWLTQLGGWGDEMQGRMELSWNNMWAGSEKFSAGQRSFWKGVGDGIYDGLKSANDDIEKWSDDTKQSLQDAWKGFSDWGSSGIQWIKGGAGDIWNGVTDFFKPLTDWLDYLPHANISEMIMEALPDIDLGAMLGDWLGGAKKSDGGGIEWIKGLMNDYLIKPASEWINGFIADPLSYLGAVGVDVGLIQLILNMLTGEVDPIAFMTEWVNSHIVQPLTTILQNLPQFISGLIDGLFNNTGNSENADNAGYKLGKSFGDGILRAIGEIPIVGDILRMLGLIPSTNPDANSKGKGVGDNVVMGYFKGTAKLVTDAVQEFTDIANGIAKKAHEAFAAAKGWAEQAWAGLNSIFQRHSPGFFYKSVKDEFEQMSNTINEQSSEAYSSAQTYGQSVYDGVVPFMEAMSNQIDQNMVTLDENINSEAIAQYKTDANTAEQIATSTVADSQMAFDGLGSNVGTVLADMGGKLVSTYNGMNADQTSLLNNMKNNNTNAYKTMQTQTTSSLTNMRNSTQTVTNQMTSAWILMKNNIVTAANQLKTQSNSHFNQLSSTIGSFYRKLQNPANWGGSPNEITVSGKPSNLTKGASAMRKIISQPTSRFAGGKAAGTPFPNTTTISIKELLKMFGNDNKILSRKVNLGDLLGDDFLFGNWSDWYPKHYNQIKQTTGNWDMKGPALLNYIDTGMAFKVKEFENGSPNVSWNSFKQMGEALFSAIPYDFYYNHDKTGDWVSALYTGSVNCVDGNEALLALANTCGFSGHLAHGTWKGVAHVYAVINGQKMDATGWQQRRSWAGVAAGSPSKSSYAKLGSEETTNITIDLREATIYGVDDLERTIENAVQKGLQKEINVSTITGV